MSDDLIRDEELGAALRALPVPEHREGFWDSALDRDDLRSRRPNRNRRTPMWLAAAVVVALAGLAAITFGRGDDDGTGVVAGPPGVTQMLTGTLEGVQSTGSGPDEFRQRFAVAVDGSSSFESTDGTGGQTFDARTRRLATSSQEGSGQGIGWFLRENIEPKVGSLSTFLSALVVRGAGTGERTTALGRPAERFVETGALRALGNRGEADRIEAVLDVETGILLRYEATLAGAVVARLEVVELTASEQIDRARFEVDVPAGDEIIRTSDERVRLVQLDELDGIVGYEIQAPTDVAGFRLDSVAARPGMPGSQSGVPNPLDRDRVQLVYRDGWRGVEVIVHRRGDTSALPDLPPANSESTRAVGDFTVTVRGALDAAGREDLLDRITPQD